MSFLDKMPFTETTVYLPTFDNSPLYYKIPSTYM